MVPSMRPAAQSSRPPLPARVNVPPRRPPGAAAVPPRYRRNGDSTFWVPVNRATDWLPMFHEPEPEYFAPLDAVTGALVVTSCAPPPILSVPCWSNWTAVMFSVPCSSWTVPSLSRWAGLVQQARYVMSFDPMAVEMSVPPGLMCSMLGLSIRRPPSPPASVTVSVPVTVMVWVRYFIRLVRPMIDPTPSMVIGTLICPPFHWNSPVTLTLLPPKMPTPQAPDAPDSCMVKFFSSTAGTPSTCAAHRPGGSSMTTESPSLGTSCGSQFFLSPQEWLSAAGSCVLPTQL